MRAIRSAACYTDALWHLQRLLQALPVDGRDAVDAQSCPEEDQCWSEGAVGVPGGLEEGVFVNVGVVGSDVDLKVGGRMGIAQCAGIY